MIRKMLRFIIVIIVTFAFVFSVSAIKNSNLFAPEVYKLKTINLGTNLNANFGEITNAKVIEQSFSAKQDGLAKVELFFLHLTGKMTVKRCYLYMKQIQTN